MTYKEIVDLLGSVADLHKMIADWGYGELSDIKTRAASGDASYPYMFINPASGTRDAATTTWTFNLIMMEIVGPTDDFLKAQSECALYLNDVIGYLQLYLTGPNDPQPVFNVQLQPFKERFQDEVAGMTAILQVIVKQPLNDCIAPFVDPVEIVEEPQVTGQVDGPFFLAENNENIIEEQP
jgi:hypothetical protein